MMKFFYFLVCSVDLDILCRWLFSPCYFKIHSFIFMINIFGFCSTFWIPDFMNWIIWPPCQWNCWIPDFGFLGLDFGLRSPGFRYSTSKHFSDSPGLEFGLSYIGDSTQCSLIAFICLHFQSKNVLPVYRRLLWRIAMVKSKREHAIVYLPTDLLAL